MRPSLVLALVALVLSNVNADSVSFAHLFNSNGVATCSICGSGQGQYSCSNSYFASSWLNGTFSFPDPLPRSATLNQIAVQLTGLFGCAAQYAQVGVFINGALVGTISPSHGVGCPCSACDVPGVVSSPVYNQGFPGYNYGGSNTAQIVVFNAQQATVCLAAVNFTLSYDLAEAVLAPGIPVSATLQPSATSYWRLEVNQANSLLLTAVGAGSATVMLKKDSLPTSNSYDYLNTSANPSLYISKPAQGTYYVGLTSGSSQTTTFILNATVGDNVPIRNDATISGVVPAGTSYVYNIKCFFKDWAQFNLNVTNAHGLAYLLVSNGTIPTRNNAQWYTYGSKMLTLTINNPPDGIYYISVYGVTYTNYELVAFLTSFGDRRRGQPMRVEGAMPKPKPETMDPVGTLLQQQMPVYLPTKVDTDQYADMREVETDGKLKLV